MRVYEVSERATFSSYRATYGIPAFLMPATNGDEPAPDPPEVIMGSFEGQITPIASTLPT
jgi:hypothetical protein